MQNLSGSRAILLLFFIELSTLNGWANMRDHDRDFETDVSSGLVLGSLEFHPRANHVADICADGFSKSLVLHYIWFYYEIQILLILLSTKGFRWFEYVNNIMNRKRVWKGSKIIAPEETIFNADKLLYSNFSPF